MNCSELEKRVYRITPIEFVQEKDDSENALYINKSSETEENALMALVKATELALKEIEEKYRARHSIQTLNGTEEELVQVTKVVNKQQPLEITNKDVMYGPLTEAETKAEERKYGSKI